MITFKHSDGSKQLLASSEGVEVLILDEAGEVVSTYRLASGVDYIIAPYTLPTTAKVAR